MKKWIAAFCVLSVAAFAAPSTVAPDAAPQGHSWGDPAARAEHFAQKLGLNATQAQQLKTVMEQFKTQTQAIHASTQTARETLHRAAEGDAAAGAQVDASIATLRDARSKMHDLQLQMFNKAAEGMTPQQKAKMALALEHMGHGAGRHGGWAQHRAATGQQP